MARLKFKRPTTSNALSGPPARNPSSPPKSRVPVAPKAQAAMPDTSIPSTRKQEEPQYEEPEQTRDLEPEELNDAVAENRRNRRKEWQANKPVTQERVRYHNAQVRQDQRDKALDEGKRTKYRSQEAVQSDLNNANQRIEDLEKQRWAMTGVLAGDTMRQSFERQMAEAEADRERFTAELAESKRMREAETQKGTKEWVDKRIESLQKTSQKTFQDNNLGEIGAGLTQGTLSEMQGEAWADYLADPSNQEKKRYAMALDAAAQRFQENNEKPLQDDKDLAALITHNASTYAPQFLNQEKSKLVGGLSGAAIGTYVAPGVGTATGYKVGAAAKSGYDMYQRTKGSVYSKFISEGYTHDEALAAANDEALISGLIESGDTALEFATLGTKGLVNKFGSDGLKSAVAKMGKETAAGLVDKPFKTVGKLIGKAAIETAQEGLEESTQEAVSIANEDRMRNGTGTGKWDLVKGSTSLVFDAATGKNPEAAQRMLDAGIEGMKTAVLPIGLDASAQTVATVRQAAQISGIGKQVRLSGVDLEDGSPVKTGEVDLISDTLKLAPKDSESYKLASKLQDAYNKKGAQAVSDFDIGRLYLQVQEDSANEQAGTKAPAAPQSKRQEAEQQQEVVQEMAQSGNPAEVEYAEVQTANPDKSVVSPTAQTLMDTGMDPKQAVTQASLIDAVAHGQVLGNKQTKALDLQNPSVRAAFEQATGTQVNPNALKGEGLRRTAKAATQNVQQKQALVRQEQLAQEAAQRQAEQAQAEAIAAQQRMEAARTAPLDAKQERLVSKLVRGDTLTQGEAKQIDLQNPAVLYQIGQRTGVNLSGGYYDSLTSKRADLQNVTNEVNTAAARAQVEPETTAAPVTAAIDTEPHQAAQATQETAVETAPAPAPVREQKPKALIRSKKEIAEEVLKRSDKNRKEAAEKATSNLPDIEFEDGSKMSASDYMEAYMKRHTGASAAHDAVTSYTEARRMNEMRMKVPGSAKKPDFRSSLRPTGGEQSQNRSQLTPDMVRARQDLTVSWLNNISKKFGVTVKWDDDLNDQQNGFYDPTDKSIHLNRNLAGDNQKTITTYFAHELTHGAQNGNKQFTNDVLAVMESIEGKDRVAEIRSATDKVYRNYFKAHNLDTSVLDQDNYINDEVAADYIAKAVGNRKLLDQIAGRRPRIVQKMLNWLENAMSTRDKDVKAHMTDLQNLAGKMNRALEAGKKQTGSGDVRNSVSDEKATDVRYSINPRTGFEKGTAEDALTTVLQGPKPFDERVDDLVKWAEQVTREEQENERKMSDEERALRDRIYNVTPLTEEEQKRNEEAIDRLLKKYGMIEPGENPSRPIILPKKTSDTTAVNKGVRTILETELVPESAIPLAERAILADAKNYTHTIATDKEAMDKMKFWKKRSLETNMQEWNRISGADLESGEGSVLNKVTKNDMALGAVCLEQAAAMNDANLTMKMIGEISIAATQAGQTAQAMQLLKKMTPAGQLYYLKQAVNRLNKQAEYEKKIQSGKMQKIHIDPELAQVFLDAQTEQEKADAMENLKANIAMQMPVSMIEKWDAWRYFSMLGNARTHGRNIFSNAILTPVTFAKDIMGVILESPVKNGTRTKNLNQIVGSALYGLSLNGKFGVKDKLGKYVQFADADFANVSDVLDGGGKYNLRDDLRDKRVIFKNKWLEAARKKNSKWLSDEDTWFMKTHYVRAMSQYLAANKVDLSTLDSKEGQKILQKARAWAVMEAEKATFHDASVFATALNRLERSGVAGKIAVGSIMPFKKTPINVAKRGIEYSTFGFIKTAIDAARGKSPEVLLDSLAQNLTGTAIAVAGFFLAKNGTLRASGSDDEEERKFELMQGLQPYSLNWGDGKSYSIDWAAPAALPLFVGAELYEMLFKQVKSEGRELTLSMVFDALTLITEPMFTLSYLDGLNKTLSASKYDTEGNPLTSTLASMMTNYLTQAIPTVVGQGMRSLDGTRRTYYNDPNSKMPKFVDRAIQTAAMKVVPQTQAAFVDPWGRKQTEEHKFLGALENFLSPGYYNGSRKTAADDALLELYHTTKNARVFPPRMKKYINYKDEDGNTVQKNLTAEEWETYQTISGQISLELVTSIVHSKGYAEMDDKMKQDALAEAYGYAEEIARAEILGKHDNKSPLAKHMEQLEGSGISTEDVIIARAYNKADALEGKSGTEKIMEMTWLSDKDRGLLINATRENGLGNDDTTLADPNKSYHEFVLTPTQAQQYQDHLDAEWNKRYAEQMRDPYYRRATPAEQAAYTDDLHNQVKNQTRDWMVEKLNKAGVKSRETPELDANMLHSFAHEDDLVALFNSTGDSGVLPKVTTRTVSSMGKDGESEKMDLTPAEWGAYQMERETLANDLINEVMASERYKAMNDDERADAIKKCYSLTDAQALQNSVDRYKPASASEIRRTRMIEKGMNADSYILDNAHGDTEEKTIQRLQDESLTPDDVAWLTYDDYSGSVSSSFTDPYTKKHEYHLNPEQAAEYQGMFEDMFVGEVRQLYMNPWFRNAGPEYQADQILKLRKSVNKSCKQEMSRRLHNQGIEPVPSN